MISEMEQPPRAVIFDMGAQDMIDVTSQEVTKSISKELQGRGIEIYLADLHSPLVESGMRTGLLDTISKDHILPNVESAVQFIEIKTIEQETRAI